MASNYGGGAVDSLQEQIRVEKEKFAQARAAVEQELSTLSSQLQAKKDLEKALAVKRALWHVHTSVQAATSKGIHVTVDESRAADTFRMVTLSGRNDVDSEESVTSQALTPLEISTYTAMSLPDVSETAVSVGVRVQLYKLGLGSYAGQTVDSDAAATASRSLESAKVMKLGVAHLERRIKELERKIQGEKRRELDIHSNWKQVLEKTLQLQNEFAHSSDVHKRTTEELRAQIHRAKLASGSIPTKSKNRTSAVLAASRAREEAVWSRRVELAQRSADLKFDNGVALIKSTLAAWVDSVRESSEKEVQERVGAAHQRKSELTDRVLQLDHAIEVINRELSTIDRSSYEKMVLNTALESAKSLRTAKADVPRLDEWSQRNEAAKKVAESTAILDARHKRDSDAAEATRVAVIGKVADGWEDVHEPVADRLAFLWRVDELVPYSDVSREIWAKHALAIDMASKLEGTQDTRTSVASSLKAVLQKQKDAVDKTISASVDSALAPSAENSRFFTPIQPSVGSGAVPGITTGIGATSGPRRQLFPTLKVDTPTDFVPEGRQSQPVDQPSETVERVKALLLSATRASETPPDRSVSPFSMRTNTPSSLVSRGGYVHSRRPSGDVSEVKSRSASVDPPVKPFLKRSSRSLLGSSGKNVLPAPQPVISQPKPLTPADSVVVAALAPMEKAVSEEMQLQLDRLRLEMRAQQVESDFKAVSAAFNELTKPPQ